MQNIFFFIANFTRLQFPASVVKYRASVCAYTHMRQLKLRLMLSHFKPLLRFFWVFATTYLKNMYYFFSAFELSPAIFTGQHDEILKFFPLNS